MGIETPRQTGGNNNDIEQLVMLGMHAHLYQPPVQQPMAMFMASRLLCGQNFLG